MQTRSLRRPSVHARSRVQFPHGRCSPRPRVLLQPDSQDLRRRRSSQSGLRTGAAVTRPPFLSPLKVWAQVSGDEFPLGRARVPEPGRSRLNARPRRQTGSKPAFRRNAAERVYMIEAAHNSQVAGSNPAPATAEGPGNGPFGHSGGYAAAGGRDGPGSSPVGSIVLAGDHGLHVSKAGG